jgi:hypothetical protein
MTTNLLTHIATARLPMTFHRAEEIDQVRILQAAGLVIAQVPAPGDPLIVDGAPSAAQVLAMTQKGRDEVAAQAGFRDDAALPRWRTLLPRLRERIRIGRP